MTDYITIIPQAITPARSKISRKHQQESVSHRGNFDKLLQHQIEQGSVKFSKHASGRMASRGISFDDNQIRRLESAVSQVNAKGGKESLVMLDNTALVVSIKNDTVVTVVDKEQLRNNVFTNIDSAVIA